MGVYEADFALLERVRVWSLFLSFRPVSIVYYLKPDEVDTYLRLKNSTVLRDNVHLSYMIQHNNSQYPINALRNKAIEPITTSHWYFSDMDNWPSRPFSLSPSYLAGLYDALLRLPRSALEDDKLIIIVPAYQIKMSPCDTFQQCVSMFPLFPFFPPATPRTSRRPRASCAPASPTIAAKPSVPANGSTTTTRGDGSTPARPSFACSACAPTRRSRTLS